MSIFKTIGMKMLALNSSKQAQSSTSLIGSLSIRLFAAALKCTEACKSNIENRYGKDTSESKFMLMRVHYEYLFFLSHMVDRAALSECGDMVRSKLQDELYPLLQKGSTEAFCGGWPIDIKNQVSADFILNINTANEDYAKYNTIYDQNAPFAQSSIVGKLVQRISDVLSMHDMALSVVNAAVGMEALVSLNMKKEVTKVCKTLGVSP